MGAFEDSTAPAIAALERRQARRGCLTAMLGLATVSVFVLKMCGGLSATPPCDVDGVRWEAVRTINHGMRQQGRGEKVTAFGDVVTVRREGG